MLIECTHKHPFKEHFVPSRVWFLDATNCWPSQPAPNWGREEYSSLRLVALKPLRENPVLKLASMTAIALSISSVALAQSAAPARLDHMIPANSATVTDWYKQSVYDPKDNKVGEIMDVLLDKSGKVTSLIVGVGGFLGAGEKDVSVPFDAVHVTNKNNNKWYLVMNATKDELKRATGFTYDKESTTWVPEKK